MAHYQLPVGRCPDVGFDIFEAKVYRRLERPGCIFSSMQVNSAMGKSQRERAIEEWPVGGRHLSVRRLIRLDSGLVDGEANSKAITLLSG